MHNTQDDELVKIARAILEGTYAEATVAVDDQTVIDSVKKLFPSGAVYEKFNNSLTWEKSGGYAGEKSIGIAREKLEKAGFKYSNAKSVGLPDGSTAGFRIYLLNKKLGWYVTIVLFYGQSASSNRYSITLKKVEKKA